MAGKQIHSLEELQAAAQAFVQTLVPLESGATLVTLSGELGAGKTAFTKAIAQALGVEETVNSPTFVLEKIYSLPEESQGFLRLVHIDAYRLEKGGDLAPLGFAPLMQNSKNLVVLEWPERVLEGLPTPAHAIHIESGENDVRTLSYA